MGVAVLRVLRVAFAVIVCLLALEFSAVQLSRTDSTRDLAVYHRAAQAARAGATLYDHLPEPGTLRSSTFPYLYPPQFAATLSVLMPRNYVAFARTWTALLIVAFWMYAALLARIATGRTGLYTTLLAAVLLASTPGTLGAIALGQADVLVWLAIGLAIASPAVRGPAFASAALIKLYTGWCILADVFRGERRTWLHAIAAVAVLTTLAALVMGPVRFASDSWTWLTRVLPRIGQGQLVPVGAVSGSVWGFDAPLPALPFNLSLSVLPLRLLWPNQMSLPPAAHAYLLAAAVLPPLAVAWFGRRWPAEWQAMAVIAAALLFAPVFRLGYIAALAPVGALAIRRALHPDPRHVTCEDIEPSASGMCPPKWSGRP